MYKTIIAVAMATAGALSAGAASAVSIGAPDFAACVGLQTCNLGAGITATAAPVGTPLAIQNYRSVSGLGVGTGTGTGGDNSPGDEIQGRNSESITFGSTGRVFTGFTLAHFYNTAAFSNDPNEIAIIEFSNAGGSLGTLEIQNNGYTAAPAPFTPVFTTSFSPGVFSGVVTGVSFSGAVTGNTNKGLFEVTGLAALGATSIRFSADAAAGPNGNDGSDYSIASISAVPLPAAAWLLLGGLGAMGLVARKRNRA